MNRAFQGHAMALTAVLIWGMTFICSKVLVGLLDSYWLIVIRFLIAWTALFLCAPKPLRLLPRKQEVWFVLSGLTGVTLYYGLQNIALLYSTASNTGVIAASSPLFTALLLWFFGRRVRLSKLFFLGFLLCMGGVALITFRSSGGEGGHLLGDAAALGSTIVWGSYGVVILRNEGSGLSQLRCTRKIFFWGIVLTLPLALLLGEPVPLTVFTQGGVSLWGNLLFVGLLSSSLSYLFWGMATDQLGAVTTNVYLYLVPAVSVMGSALLLHEEIDGRCILGIAGILLGLVFSQKGSHPVSNT